MVRDLQRLFDEGQASPYDRTADGSTLLHAACNHLNSLRGHESRDIIIDYLAKSGCPTNETDFSGMDPLGLLVRLSDIRKPVSHLIIKGAVIKDKHLRYSSPKWNEHVWIIDEGNFFLSDIAHAAMSSMKGSAHQTTPKNPQSISSGYISRLARAILPEKMQHDLNYKTVVFLTGGQQRYAWNWKLAVSLLLQTLYQGGFRDIDELDNRSDNPIPTNSFYYSGFT
ncbi:hypothetical protein BJY01DRAFT_250699 [Aspergillus pseudoustus]|uniref:Ankyrin repeat-containing domain protein n=1 Tax=Aspergillus pseudoustus TaxID=1810923 RepID=A0ABR4JJD6_9EURO